MFLLFYTRYSPALASPAYKDIPEEGIFLQATQACAHTLAVVAVVIGVLLGTIEPTDEVKAEWEIERQPLQSLPRQSSES
jgi:hypothetical protein